MEADVTAKLTETYLQILALIDKAQNPNRRYDLTLVTPKQHNNDSQLSQVKVFSRLWYISLF